jgi:hypothetical protein
VGPLQHCIHPWGCQVQGTLFTDRYTAMFTATWRKVRRGDVSEVTMIFKSILEIWKNAKAVRSWRIGTRDGFVE